MVFNAIPTIFQSYRGSQFYWRKPEYPEKTTDLFKSLTNFITYCWIEYASRVGFELTSTDCTQVDASPTTIQYDYDHDGSFIPGHTIKHCHDVCSNSLCIGGIQIKTQQRKTCFYNTTSTVYFFLGGWG
jgi:hypothetical protein